MLIAIDQGHGATTNPYPDGIHCEGFQMYQLGYYLFQELKSLGRYNLVCTRLTSKQNPSLEDRGKAAAGADLFISLHSNAAVSTTVKRVVVIPNIYNLDEDFRTLCQDIGDAVKTAMAIPEETQIYYASYQDVNTGKTMNYYRVLRNAVAAGCERSLIVEHSFHTTPAMAELLSQDSVLKLIAKKEAEVIDRYFHPSASPSYWGRSPEASVTYKDLWEILHDPHAD